MRRLSATLYASAFVLLLGTRAASATDTCVLFLVPPDTEFMESKKPGAKPAFVSTDWVIALPAGWDNSMGLLNKIRVDPVWTSRLNAACELDDAETERDLIQIWYKPEEATMKKYWVAMAPLVTVPWNYPGNWGGQDAVKNINTVKAVAKAALADIKKREQLAQKKPDPATPLHVPWDRAWASTVEVLLERGWAVDSIDPAVGLAITRRRVVKDSSWTTCGGKGHPTMSLTVLVSRGAEDSLLKVLSAVSARPGSDADCSSTGIAEEEFRRAVATAVAGTKRQGE